VDFVGLYFIITLQCTAQKNMYEYLSVSVSWPSSLTWSSWTWICKYMHILW